MSTKLVINGVPMSKYATRGVKESMGVLEDSSQTRRTINKVLRYVGVGEPARKFTFTYQGEDLTGLPIDALYVGLIVTFHAVGEFSKSGLLPPDPNDWTDNIRPIVPGSLRQGIDGFIYYRPVITGMVTSFSTELDEWGAVTSWSLELAEV